MRVPRPDTGRLAARCGGSHLGPAAVLLASAHALFGVSAAPAPAAIDFNRDVRPILAANCYKCYGIRIRG